MPPIEEMTMIETLRAGLAILEALPPSLKALLALCAIGVFFLFLITLILVAASARKAPPAQTTLILIGTPPQPKEGGDCA